MRQVVGGREAVGGGIDIDSEEKKMGKKAKNLSTCFQGNRELLSISLTYSAPLPPPAFAALASHSDAGTSSD